MSGHQLPNACQLLSMQFHGDCRNRKFPSGPPLSPASAIPQLHHTCCPYKAHIPDAAPTALVCFSRIEANSSCSSSALHSLRWPPQQWLLHRRTAGATRHMQMHVLITADQTAWVAALSSATAAHCRHSCAQLSHSHACKQMVISLSTAAHCCHRDSCDSCALL